MKAKPTTTEIGQRIREERIKKGWSPEDLAKNSGVKLPTIYNLENGARKGSDVSLAKVGKALEVDAAYLRYGTISVQGEENDDELLYWLRSSKKLTTAAKTRLETMVKLEYQQSQQEIKKKTS